MEDSYKLSSHHEAFEVGIKQDVPDKGSSQFLYQTITIFDKEVMT
jgi:hypothetical protein